MSLLPNFLKYGELEYTHKKLGTQRVTRVLREIGDPHLKYPAVLIGGTNGKGTVGRILESILLQAGYPVGLYTSPHVERFNERIRVGGAEESDQELESALQFFLDKGLLSEQGALRVPGEEETLTWFEKTTVLAFEVFRRRKISLALLEVGLGARLDATNVVDPLVSVITSVSRDHTEVLGESLFEIAREKSAVMRPGRPLILGPMQRDVRTFLNKAARLAGAKPVTPEPGEGSVEDFHYGPL
ncbi:MAG: Mur ligase family protein, partial [bacterium]|nr:Mur ligase family protein [bacterium]